MLPDPNTPPITPPGIRVSAANSRPWSWSNRLMQAEVWPGVYITLRRKLPRSIRLPSSSQISTLIGTFGSLNILRSIEKSSRSMILLAASRCAAMMGGQPDVDHDGSGFSAHQIGIRSAVLEADLIDVLGRLNQRADVIVQENRKRAGLAVAHGLAALKVTALDALKRLLSASMIISANAGCWLTR